MTGDVSAMSPAPGPQSASRSYQLDAGALGALSADVSLFQGTVALPLALAAIAGPAGDGTQVSAAYQGAAARTAPIWNLDAPTGVLGLGWSFAPDRISVDGKTSENPLDGRYVLQSGGVQDQLVWYGSDGGLLLFQCASRPLWRISYDPSAETWRVLREDGSSTVFGDPASGSGAVMYGVCWGNWIGASRAASADLRRYPVAWNLAAAHSPWGETTTWTYDNDEVEIAGGLTYTRAAYIDRVRDATGGGATFRYEQKHPDEYVAPHQTPDGAPDPSYQDRYETRVLVGLDVSGGAREEDLAYSLRFGYELRALCGPAESGFVKRLLTEIRQERLGRLALPPARFGYRTDPAGTNPGGLESILYPQGGTAQISYTDAVLGPGPDAPPADDVFRSSITVKRPVSGAVPMVFQGPDYVVTAWYSDSRSSTTLQVYCAGGSWSQPWTYEIPGQIQTRYAQFAAAGEFFALYLPDVGGTGNAVVRLFRKRPGRFGEWNVSQFSVSRTAPEIPQETTLRAGTDFAVLHIGGDSTVRRYWWEPAAAGWSEAAHSQGGSRHIAVAARGEYFIVAWYDDKARSATYQLFHLDVTGAWRAGPVGTSGEQFDWDPDYAVDYWALGDSFAIATYTLYQTSRFRLRTLQWEADFAVARDSVRDGRSATTSIVGALAGNGPLLLRFDGTQWRTFELSGGVDAAFAYGEDLAVQSIPQGSTTRDTVVAYNAATGTWSVLPANLGDNEPGAADPGRGEPGHADPGHADPGRGEPGHADLGHGEPGRGETGHGQPGAGAPGAAVVWGPSCGGRVVTTGSTVRWRSPAGALSTIAELPAVGAAGSLHNLGPSYLLYQSDPTDQNTAATTALVLRNGAVAEKVVFARQRIAVGDAKVGNSRMAGPRLFVTYPADAGTLAGAYEVTLHRLTDRSLSDNVTVPVVSGLRIDAGYDAVQSTYGYDTAHAVFDPSGSAVFFPFATRIAGPNGAGGRTEYRFHNGLVGTSGPDEQYSLLTGTLLESRIFDADGFEVAANRSTWTTRPLAHGAASPIGVVLPESQPQLVGSESVTGRLRLFDLPGDQAAGLDAGTLSPVVRDAFAAAGLPLGPGASVAAPVPGKRWEIIDGASVHPVGRITDAYGNPQPLLEVYGSIAKSYTNTYDAATGMLIGQRTEDNGPSGTPHTVVRAITHAWRVPQYSGMIAAHMLTAVAEEQSTDLTAGIALCANAATYRAVWPTAAAGVWAESENWTWRGDTAALPPFDHDPAGDRSAWVRDSLITDRNRFGAPLVGRSVFGVPTSFLYDLDDRRVTATLTNVDLGAPVPAGCALGFEPYERNQGWGRVDGLPLDTLVTDQNPHTGSRCLRLADGIEVRARFELPAGSGRALLACWVRTAPGLPAGSGAGWTVRLSPVTGGEATVTTLAVTDTAGDWTRLWVYLDPPDASTATAVTITGVNPLTEFPVFIDDLRFAPLEGGVTTTVYAGDTRLILASLDQNNVTTRLHYDHFLRLVTVSQPGPSLGAVCAVAYARGTSDDPRADARSRSTGDSVASATAFGIDRFDPNNPNTLTIVEPTGQARVLDFGPWSDWRAHWDAQPAAAWSDQDAVLRHHGPQPGTLTLRDTQGDSWYAVRIDPVAGTDPVAATTGVGIGDLTVRWDPPTGAWQLLRAGALIKSAPALPPGTADWLLIAQPDAVLFLVDGRQLLAHRFTDPVGGSLVLTAAGEGQGFARVMVLHQPVVSIEYLDGAGNPRQSQYVDKDGLIVSGILSDQLARPTVSVKAMSYPGALPGYRPSYATGLDPATGKLSGDVAAYYSGGERSDDQGYPYSRQLLEAADTARTLETGLPGAVHAIVPRASQAPHTVRTAHGAKVADGFLDHLPPGGYPTTTVADPDGKVAVTIADPAGRVLGTRTEPDTLDLRTACDYDERGNVIREYSPAFFAPRPGQDPQSGVTERVHDGLGRVTAERSADSGLTETVYDDRDLARFILYADGRSARPGIDPDRIAYFCYDRLGRQIEAGIVEAVWDRAALQRAAGTDWPEQAPGWRTRTSYDGDGSAADAIGRAWYWAERSEPQAPAVETRYTFDQAGRVAECRERRGDQDPEWITGYTYLPSGQPDRYIYPHHAGEQDAAPVVRYGYDQLGRPAQIGTGQDPAAYAAYGYNADGAIAYETLTAAGPAPVTRRMRYNSLGLLVAADSPALSERIAYWEEPGDDGGTYYGGQAARISYKVAGGGGDVPSDYTWRFSYDRDGRLRTASNSADSRYDFGTGGPAAYDANGNMLSVREGGQAGGRDRTFGYLPQGNRLASADGREGFGYDASGQTTATPAERVRALGNDPVTGAPRFVEAADGGRLDLAARGVDGRRWSAVWTGPDGAPATERRYLAGAGSAPLTEISRTGPQDAWRPLHYVHGLGGLVAVIGEGSVPGGRAAVVRDRLGSNRLLLGADGGLLGRYDYRPFGDLMGQAEGALPDLLRYRYLGRERDAETGLTDLTARLYDPGLFRFYAVDPAGASPSPYTYADGDPVNYADPEGQFAFIPLLIAIAIGAAVGGISSGVAAAATGASVEESFKQAGIGAAIGALSGAVSFGVGGALATSLATRAAVIGASRGQIFAAGLAVGAVSGMVDGAVSGGLSAVAAGASAKEAFTQAGIGAGIGFGLGLVGGLVAERASMRAVTGGFQRAEQRGVTVVNGANFGPENTMVDADNRMVRYGINRGVTRHRAEYGNEIPRPATEGSLLEIVSHGTEGTGLRMPQHSPVPGRRFENAVSAQTLAAMTPRGYGRVSLIACRTGQTDYAQTYATATGLITRAPNAGVSVRERGMIRVRDLDGAYGEMLAFHPNRHITVIWRIFGF